MGITAAMHRTHTLGMRMLEMDRLLLTLTRTSIRTTRILLRTDSITEVTQGICHMSTYTLDLAQRLLHIPTLQHTRMVV